MVCPLQCRPSCLHRAILAHGFCVVGNFTLGPHVTLA